MDATLKNLAIWIVAGLAIGIIGYYIYGALAGAPQQPSLPGANTTLPANQTPPAQNGTPQIPPAQPQQNIRLVLITADSCASCNSTASLASQVSGFLNATANITTGEPRAVQGNSEEGKALIAKYNLTKLPALLITGGLNNSDFISRWSPGIGSVESDGVLVSRETYPPYYDIATGKVSGMVAGIAILPSDCSECVNGSQYLASLEGPSFSVIFANKTVLGQSDSEAQALIAKYNVTKLPTVLLDSEITAYPFYTKQILPLGTYGDGWYVLRNVSPPYLELPSGSVRGRVEIVYLKNSSCADCLNITEIGTSIAQMIGASVNGTSEYEIGSAEGAALAKKYNVSKIPTALFSPELSVYPQVSEWWASQNNTVESDGWLVLRSLDQMVRENQTYQNISAQ